jgi:hypothetical protein
MKALKYRLQNAYGHVHDFQIKIHLFLKRLSTDCKNRIASHFDSLFHECEPSGEEGKEV